MTLDCKNSSGWDKKNTTEKSNNNLFLCSCCRRLWFPKQLNYSSDVPAFGIFLPLAAPAFFVFLEISISHVVTHWLHEKRKENNTVVAFELRKKLQSVVWSSREKNKSLTPICLRKKRHVTFCTTPPCDFHSSRSTPTFTLSACPLPRSPLSHLPEKRRGGWELPR